MILPVRNVLCLEIMIYGYDSISNDSLIESFHIWTGTKAWGRKKYLLWGLAPKSSQKGKDSIPPKDTIQFIKPDKLVPKILHCLFESRMNVGWIRVIEIRNNNGGQCRLTPLYEPQNCVCPVITLKGGPSPKQQFKG